MTFNLKKYKIEERGEEKTMLMIATADLHIYEPKSKTIKLLSKHIKKEKPDVVVIAGDVYDYRGIITYDNTKPPKEF